MILLLLYLLASLDGLLCGCRTAMGRCALIRKRRYYTRALIHGFLAAQVVSVLALFALLLVDSLYVRDQHLLRTDLNSAAVRMLWIFLPYSAVVLLSLALRLLPSIDIRSATSVFVLGPLTAIRPLVMVSGVVYGVSASLLRSTQFLGAFILLLMLSVEFSLNRLAYKRQVREIAQIV